MTCLSWIIRVDAKRQCTLAGVSRTTMYAQRKPVLVIEIDVLLKRLIDEEYTRHPFNSSRKMVVYLRRFGHRVNRKRTQRLMRSIGLAAIVPGQNMGLVQGVPVFVAWRGGGAAQPSLEHGHHLYPFGAGLCISDGHHGLVLEEGAELAYQQQHGGGILRGLL